MIPIVKYEEILKKLGSDDEYWSRDGRPLKVTMCGWLFARPQTELAAKEVFPELDYSIFGLAAGSISLLRVVLGIGRQVTLTLDEQIQREAGGTAIRRSTVFAEKSRQQPVGATRMVLSCFSSTRLGTEKQERLLSTSIPLQPSIFSCFIAFKLLRRLQR